ncbi:MAG: hypothetical protein ACLFTI_11495 [Anaerolineales bacterium]
MMPVKPVITNNTPLIALWSVGKLELLRELFGEVWAPQAVCDEFLAAEPALRQATLESSPWIHCISLQDPQHVAVYIGIDRGESEVLALAEESEPRLVIMDELRGRRYAKRLGWLKPPADIQSVLKRTGVAFWSSFSTRFQRVLGISLEFIRRQAKRRKLQDPGQDPND